MKTWRWTMCKKSYINAQQLVHIYLIFNVRVGTAILLECTSFSAASTYFSCTRTVFYAAWCWKLVFFVIIYNYYFNHSHWFKALRVLFLYYSSIYFNYNESEAFHIQLTFTLKNNVDVTKDRTFQEHFCFPAFAQVWMEVNGLYLDMFS